MKSGLGTLKIETAGVERNIRLCREHVPRRCFCRIGESPKAGAWRQPGGCTASEQLGEETPKIGIGLPSLVCTTARDYHPTSAWQLDERSRKYNRGLG